jgi:Domain of unknown function (DUF4271)
LGSKSVIYFILILLLSFVSADLFGQDSSIVNPVITSSELSSIIYSSDTVPTFFRKKRVKPIDSSQITTIIDSSILYNAADSSFPKNPFDFDYYLDIKKIENEQEPIQNITPEKVLKKAVLNKDNYIKNFNFWVLMFLFTILALLLRNSRNAIKLSYNGFINNSNLRLLLNENGSYGTLDFVQMNLFYWLNFGFFIFQLLHHFNITIHSSLFISVIICIASTIILMALKHLVLVIIGSVYPLDKEMKSYSFILLIAGVLLGILLLPMNLIIAFSSGEIQKYTIYSTLAIIGLSYVILSVKTILINANSILNSIFHFLLYLCAIETAPALILYRFIRNKLGI